MDNLRFTQEPPTTCKPPDLFEGKVGAKVKGKFGLKGKNLLVPIQCLLPEGASDPCVGNVTVTTNSTGTSASAAKKVTVAKGSYSVDAWRQGQGEGEAEQGGQAPGEGEGQAQGQGQGHEHDQ